MNRFQNPPRPRNILRTGLDHCYDPDGIQISCPETGQDPDLNIGIAWPEPRFTILNRELVQDELTGLCWTRKANFFDFPLTWNQALDEIKTMNRQAFRGFTDWRMPNRREMRSLISHGHKKPALPGDHPFIQVFLAWYWTSTTSAKAVAYAWHVHLEGGRMFYGRKDQRYLVWPVRGTPTHIPKTGQNSCFDHLGKIISCPGTGQDPDWNCGEAWPEPRFFRKENEVFDHLTNLIWYDPGALINRPLNWAGALNLVQDMKGTHLWRLPNINELESLIDASEHSPALPLSHPFTGLNDGYWSSTSSFFEPDWSYVLYLNKGAVGVGFKARPEFYVWPVRDIDQK
ncbi:DUF1566 domain-containing protein [Desulfonatronovibrio hydrogenovorans]|uniref:Lcl C-terminal domain-containing protein n=1 Tax=Desulfonatronovibrio hydrogenovorans TaxID=53245 RepID=UPI00054FA7D2|nr:DUF1566 domain-containing protein [Desulfonatronovibrio hydrogenovorans]